MTGAEGGSRTRTTSQSTDCLRIANAIDRSAGSVGFLCWWSWGFAALHPRAGSPAEHPGWGARLCAVVRSAD